MAAALLNKTCGEFFEAQSAGLEPGTINPLVVEALHELGIDVSKNTTRRVFDVWKSGQIFQFVVTVCSEAEAEGCPIFIALINPDLCRQLDVARAICLRFPVGVTS